ncbi:hypothetical protein KO504_16900 [Winogradskyella psychrotolerans]|uniref:hypothetical protein n=1 Tax=Winogradskyella psychrotolerans TaxID=1344585 RepID=UPI001C06A6D0|nr:hypothetical protein [Winogradskyella psychrotolerans]MBU2923030.1 hypothetical protein [Winogradskyella psychrotolerans]
MATKGKYNKIIFSPEDIAYLKANFKTKTNRQISDALGLKMTRVRTKAYELGLKRMELQRWTPEQVQFLKDNYKTIGDTELAEIFTTKWEKPKGWTKKHIEKKRRYLKLKRTKTELQNIHNRNVKKGRFSMCAAHMWKTIGQAPIGEIRIWHTEHNTPFLVIKQKNGFVHYNRWLWKKHKGSIPKNMNVVVKENADRTNYAIKDLELLTNAQLALRNSKNRVPPEFKETQKLLKELNKIINKSKRK